MSKSIRQTDVKDFIIRVKGFVQGFLQGCYKGLLGTLMVRTSFIV